jgi:tetratricopeptide (TPR) repeat protein
VLRVRVVVNVQHAVSIFEQVLALIPNQKMCLMQLGTHNLHARAPHLPLSFVVWCESLIRSTGAGTIWLSIRNYDKALPYLMRGVELYPLDPDFHTKFVLPRYPQHRPLSL